MGNCMSKTPRLEIREHILTPQEFYASKLQTENVDLR